MPRVEPIHAKAMPVILTTYEARDVWMRALFELRRTSRLLLSSYSPA